MSNIIDKYAAYIKKEVDQQNNGTLARQIPYAKDTEKAIAEINEQFDSEASQPQEYSDEEIVEAVQSLLAEGYEPDDIRTVMYEILSESNQEYSDEEIVEAVQSLLAEGYEPDDIRTVMYEILSD